MTLRLSQVATRRELGRPAQNAHTRWLSREAQLISLESEDGARGFGEAAPLPGFSRDTLEDCRQALAGLDVSDLPERLEPAQSQSVLEALAVASQRLPATVPAARAALETALLDLWAHARGVPAWALLGGNAVPPRPRRVAALLMGELEQILAQAEAAHTRGLTAFKLKVGQRGAIEHELLACAGLRARFGPGFDLRLDANGAWPDLVARDHLERFAVYAPEFVEEPCALAAIAGLAPPPVALALDESLLQLAADRAGIADLARWGVEAVILKPTLLGGASACAAWARAARTCSVDVILSHTFEGPLGLALCAALALTIGSEGRAHGLDLEGAGLDPTELPFFVGPEVQAWSAPGFGEPRLSA